jgi:hypothetical protein
MKYLVQKEPLQAELIKKRTNAKYILQSAHYLQIRGNFETIEGQHGRAAQQKRTKSDFKDEISSR